LGAVVLLCWTLFPREEGIAANPGIAGPEETASTDEGAAAGATTKAPSLAAETPSEDSPRSAAWSPVFLRGRLLDSGGKPVSDAEVSWHVLPAIEPDPEPSPSRESLSDEPRIQARSGADGFFEFLAAPDRADRRESLLWVTHPSYRASSFPVDGGSSGWASVRELVLDHPGAFVARVETEQGIPVPNARVKQQGQRPIPAELDSSWLSRAYRTFRRTLTTGPDGSVSLSPLAGQYVWAEFEDLKSTRWAGDGTTVPQVTLVLRSVFTARGTVRSEMPSELPADLRALAFARNGSRFVYLDQAPVRLDGTWGPIDVPGGFRTYDFTLDGLGVQPGRETVENPVSGEDVYVELVARPGVPLTVLVQDESEEAIEGAIVISEWQGGYDRGEANSEGVAKLSNCAPATVTVTATADGYIGITPTTTDLSDGTPQELTLSLERAGRIVGRCLHDGKPVESFDVNYWRGFPLNRMEIQVDDSEDGSFEIDPAPLGEVTLFGVSNEYPRSQPYSVTVLPDEPAEVTIELVDPIRGRGRVVDNATGQGVAEAVVQIYSNYIGSYFSAWGPAHSVEPDGRFEAVGFAPGDTRFVVRADGYAQWLGQGIGAPGKVLDLGVIPLAKTQPLTLILTSRDPLDFSEYKVRARGNQWYPLVSFSAGGRVVYEDAGPGFTHVAIYCPDGSAKQFETDLYPGEDWTYAIPVGSGCALRARIIGADGRSLQELGVDQVYVTSRPESGLSVRSIQVMPDEGNTVEFTGLFAGEAIIEVGTQAEKRLAMTRVLLSEPETQIDVVVGGPGLSLRVVDGTGVPLPGVWIRLFAADSDVDPLVSAITDARGEFHFQSLALAAVRVNLNHPDIGARTAIEIDLEALDEGEVVMLELDPKSKLLARLVDGTEPLPGIHVFLYDRTGTFHIGTYASDNDGRIVTGSLEADSYLTLIRQPGVWNTQGLVKATAPGSETEIQVRQLGGLALSIVTPKGKPVAGVAVSLRSEEFEADVGDWIEQGLLPVPPRGLASDAEGGLRLDGLPRGTYAYRIDGLPGSQASGTLTVPPRAIANAEIVLH
jgi:hypothetical protein